jgi:hypothetical protein
MTPGIAFANSNSVEAPGGTPLHNNNDVAVLRLALTEGIYVVVGRVVIRNFDGDGQEASARITVRDGSVISDRVVVRIGGGEAQTLALQGTLKVNNGDIVDIRCSTFAGAAGHSSLSAIEVSRLLAGPGAVIA